VSPMAKIQGQQASLPSYLLRETRSPLDCLEQELGQLRALAEQTLGHRREILVRWHDLYAMCGLGSLKKSDFFHFLGDAIARGKDDLLRSDLESYVRDMRRLGKLLSDRKLSLTETVTLNHLLQASMSRVLGNIFAVSAAYSAFETLGLVRGVLIAESYSAESALIETDTETREQERVRSANRRLADLRVPRLVGKSATMGQLVDRILAVAAYSSTVLVQGETGTGKELVARAIHECGANAGAPFIPVNCAAIPKDLIESELFGYRKGAFSGANNDYAGLFRAADTGTLFLDEITEMVPECQSKLLRAIEERAIRPVGSPSEIPITVRIIASTNREPEEAIHGGKLRRDLYYRLQAAVVPVAPLRQHHEDVPLLVDHFLTLAKRNGASVVGIEADALDALTRYSWPGNVRELANVIEGACLFGRGRTIGRKDLPAAVATFASSQNQELTLTMPGITSIQDAERHLIRMTLLVTQGNKARAAARLEISRKTLYARILRYGLHDL
jgi:transcriptional regulator with PAS, ATPase and Fis domain